MRGCPSALVERFSVSRMLGQGAFGGVYLGSLPGVEKPCALKVLRARPSPQVEVRFLREAQLLSKVRHPNLVEIYDGGVEGGIPWIAMEVVRGDDLSVVFPGGKAADPEWLEDRVLDLASALDALHEAGVVHRDLKPANVMLEQGGRLVLMDLGLALDTEATRFSRTGEIHGTPVFLAPEYFLSGEATPALDWYALGVTVDRLLRGSYPIDGGRLMKNLADGKWEPYPELPEAAAGTPLGRASRALLCPDPERRPGSRAALEALVRGEAPAGPGAAGRSGRAPTPTDASTEALPRPSFSDSVAVPAPRSRAVFLARVLGVGVVAGGLLGAGLLWRSRPDPPAPPVIEESAPSPKTRAGSGPRERWAEVCRSLGVDPGSRPEATLEMLVRSAEPEVVRPRLERLLAAGPDPGARTMAMILEERQGRSAALHERVRAVSFVEPPGSDAEAALMIRALGVRFVLEGPDTKGAEPEVAARVVADARRLEGWLRARDEPWKALAHAELWEYLSRRVHGRPTINLRACERASDLGMAELRRGDLTPERALRLLLLLNRMAARLGDFRRFRANMEVLQVDALEGITDEGARVFWRGRLAEDGEAYTWPQHLYALTRFPEMVQDPRWLPLRAEDVGSARSLEDAEVLVVEGLPAPPPRALEVTDPDRFEEAFLRDSPAARARGQQLEASAKVLRDMVAPALRDPDHPLREELLAWPGLVVTARTSGWEDAPGAWSELLEEAHELTWNARGKRAERRWWLRGPWSRFQGARARARVEAGDPEGAAAVVWGQLERLDMQHPPWSAEEIDAAAELLEAARGLPGLSREALGRRLPRVWRVLEDAVGGDG